MKLQVSPASVDEVAASELLSGLDAELDSRYPGEPINGIDAIEFRASGGFFLVAWCEGEAVGCGAFRPLDSKTIEVKRMFTAARFRGRGVGRAVLEALESEARRRGYTRSVLETAVRQPEAMALYRACGYREIERFGPYVDSARSICFGKPL